MGPHRRTPFAAALLAVVLVLAAGCGGDDDAGDDGPLPGEQVEAPPAEDAALVVVGVAAGDTLAVRSRPTGDADVVVELDALADDLVATGHNRRLDDGSTWSEVTAGDDRGWVDSSAILQLGATADITAALWPDPADRPQAPSLEALGQAVAALRASTEPASRVVVVDGPTEGDLGQVTLDVLGLGDDAVGGDRIYVFADRVPSGWQVRTVEATALCSRGVTDDQLCV